MSIEITLNKEKNTKTIYDTENPRIYKTEYKCNGCGAWLDEDDVIWADNYGKLDTKNGLAWCDFCLPFNKE